MSSAGGISDDPFSQNKCFSHMTSFRSRKSCLATHTFLVSLCKPQTALLQVLEDLLGFLKAIWEPCPHVHPCFDSGETGIF